MEIKRVVKKPRIKHLKSVVFHLGALNVTNIRNMAVNKGW